MFLKDTQSSNKTTRILITNLSKLNHKIPLQCNYYFIDRSKPLMVHYCTPRSTTNRPSTKGFIELFYVPVKNMQINLFVLVNSQSFCLKIIKFPFRPTRPFCFLYTARGKATLRNHNQGNSLDTSHLAIQNKK